MVRGDAAAGNSINANSIYDNGSGNTPRVDIDLIPTGGAAGPTVNDASDLDSGPNDLQNLPTHKGLAYTAPGTANRLRYLSHN